MGINEEDVATNEVIRVKRESPGVVLRGLREDQAFWVPCSPTVHNESTPRGGSGRPDGRRRGESWWVVEAGGRPLASSRVLLNPATCRPLLFSYLLINTVLS